MHYQKLQCISHRKAIDRAKTLQYFVQNIKYAIVNGLLTEVLIYLVYCFTRLLLQFPVLIVNIHAFSVNKCIPNWSPALPIMCITSEGPPHVASNKFIVDDDVVYMFCSVHRILSLTLEISTCSVVHWILNLWAALLSNRNQHGFGRHFIRLKLQY